MLAIEFAKGGAKPLIGKIQSTGEIAPKVAVWEVAEPLSDSRSMAERQEQGPREARKQSLPKKVHQKTIRMAQDKVTKRRQDRSKGRGIHTKPIVEQMGILHGKEKRGVGTINDIDKGLRASLPKYR